MCIINNSLVNFTNHVATQKFSFCCMVLLSMYQVRQQITMISSHELSWPMLLFFGMEICIYTSVFWTFSGKKKSFSKIALLKLQMSFWYSEQYNVELKNLVTLINLFHANLQARAISILKTNFKKLKKEIWMFYREERRD